MMGCFGLVSVDEADERAGGRDVVLDVRCWHFSDMRSCLMMSVDRGEAEIICSFRVFRILAQSGL